MDGYATAQPGVGIVVFTGVTLVFLILVLIMLLITVQGALFQKLERAKKQQPPAVQDTSYPAAELVKDEIPPETVAVIAAAVAAMDEEYRICEIKPHRQPPVPRQADAWSQAGRTAVTRPFRR